MKSAALNFFDTLIIARKYQFKPAIPFSPSAELACVMEAVGAGGNQPSSRRPGSAAMSPPARR